MRTHVSKEFWLTAWHADATAFLACVGQAGVLGRSVPSCPGWSVGDLVRHLGAIYRRIVSNVGSADVTRPWGPVVIPADAPDGADEQVVSWFAAELSELKTLLDRLDPDVPAWNWAPQAKRAGFWHRRCTHETAIHRWDAQLATGLPEPLESKLAVDTVAEVLDTFLPAGRRRTHTGAAGLVHLTASDVGHGWYVRLRGDGVALLDTDTLLDDDAHPARAEASGSASDLALALWGRVSFDVLTTTGELTLLESLRVV